MIISGKTPILGLPSLNLDPTVAPENKQLATFLFIIPSEQFAERKDRELNRLENLFIKRFQN